MVEVAVHLTSGVPRLSHPLLRKVVVVEELECFQVLLHVRCDDLRVVALQGIVGNIVAEAPKAHVELVSCLRKSDAIHLGHAAWHDMHGTRIDRWGSVNVHSFELRENIPNVALEVPVALQNGISGGRTNPIAAKKQVVRHVLFLLVPITGSAAGQQPVILSINVEDLGPIHSLQVAAGREVLVEIASQSRTDVVPIDDVLIAEFISRHLHFLASEVDDVVHHTHSDIGNVLFVKVRHSLDGTEAVGAETDHPRSVSLQFLG
mmetsp:Transcript_52596/g.140158  ORF Transcript_52596/g.140158 Transcript_52596/m.140158 type:complete len:262 (-) Transcript_52596:238-1023(-)